MLGLFIQDGTHSMKLVSRLAAACFILAIPVFLITSNVRLLTSNVGFYRHGFREYNAAGVTGVSLEDLDRAGQDIVDYFENDSSTLHVLVTEDGQEVSLFNTRETDHMKDVKWLVQVVYRLNDISLAVIIAYVAGVFLWSREKSLRTLAYQALAGVGVGALFVGVVGAFALTGFDAAWVKFHEIVFRNDLWQLNPATDHLIQMFPEGFWEESTVIVAALTIAEVVIIVALSLGYLVHTRRRDSEEPADTRGTRQGHAVPAPGARPAE